MREEISAKAQRKNKKNNSGLEHYLTLAASHHHFTETHRHCVEPSSSPIRIEESLHQQTGLTS